MPYGTMKQHQFMFYIPMIIIGENLFIAGSLENDWLHARSQMTGREGYIPRSYVAPVSTIQAKQ